MLPFIRCDKCGAKIKWVWVCGRDENKKWLCDACYYDMCENGKFSRDWYDMPENINYRIEKMSKKPRFAR